jgi:hypothetical protein
MIKFRLVLNLFALLIFTIATASLAQAQATRTWVSGVGDDANPCSRTAPCKTFAGAISKTANGGEIDAIDPGGYGQVTITKSITLDGGGGQGFASILVSSGNGVNVNASGASVTIRRLSFQGVGASANRGISATNVANLNIEDVTIQGMVNEAVFVNLSSGANVNVRDCTFRINGSAGGANGAGLRVTTSDATQGAGHTVYLSVVNTTSDSNTEGYRIENNVRATIFNSVASNNALNGFDSFPGAQTSEVNLESCVSANNKQWGVVVFDRGTFRLSNTTVGNNVQIGLNANGTGAILTYSNNKVQGNGSNGSFTGTASQN